MSPLERFFDEAQVLFSISALDMPTNTTQKKDAALDDVLNQNIEATEQIKAAANELGVVHAVLSTPIPPQSAEGDLEAAVERTEEIEQQLNETAEALDRSNELLREMGANRHSSAPTER